MPVPDERSALAMARLSEHLQYLANILIDAAGALPDGDPWVKVSGVAIELTRLAAQFDGSEGAP